MGDVNIMNQKITVLDADHKERYCIISSQGTLQEQLKEVFSIRPGYGFTVEVSDKNIRLVDYFAGETRASFEIINIEECDLPVMLYWTIL